EVTLPPRKRLSIVYCPGYKAGESSAVAAARPMEEEALTTLEGVNTRVTELAAVQEQDTQDIYGVMEDAQELKKKMAAKYCPRNEMKKIETELWNLEVQGTDLARYIGGLPDSIHGSVAASKPKTMHEATEMATGLMDKKIHTYAERQAANKRKFEDQID
nr:hypothetical protein [Tanacetum cinerariifolium]